MLRKYYPDQRLDWLISQIQPTKPSLAFVPHPDFAEFDRTSGSVTISKIYDVLRRHSFSQSTKANQPKMTYNQGGWHLVFDGTNDRMNGSSSMLPTLKGKSGATVIAATKSSADGNIIGFAQGGNNGSRYVPDTHNVTIKVADANALDFHDFTRVNGKQILGFTYLTSTAESRVLRNGGIVGGATRGVAAATFSNTDSFNVRLGCRPSDTQFFNGEIGPLFVWDTRLTDAQVKDLSRIINEFSCEYFY